MKRNQTFSSECGNRTAVLSGRARLIGRAPLVYVGPDALGALSGEKGLLLGSKRPDWVDVLVFEPHTDSKVRGLVDLRFDLEHVDWDVVGVTLSSKELDQHRNMLIRELVPGDIVLISELEPKLSKARGYVHLGSGFGAVRLKRSRAISARLRLPRS